MGDLNRRLRDLAKDFAGRHGYHIGDADYYAMVPKDDYFVLPRDYNAPLPLIDELPEDVFERTSDLPGIDFDPERQLSWAERELPELIREFGSPPGWDPLNMLYGRGDADIAYAMVRHLKPRRVIELGSGESTRVIALACARNAPEIDAVYTAFNPYPRPDLLEDLPEGLDEHVQRPAQEIPLETFAELAENDVLFVDTSHTVKLGGDVNFIVLDVLPRLAPGVYVHFHDIWLPHEYHPGLVVHQQSYWNEQYLLQAFLAFNPAIEVVFAARAVAEAFPDRLEALIPGYRTRVTYPSSFWIRRLPQP